MFWVRVKASVPLWSNLAVKHGTKAHLYFQLCCITSLMIRQSVCACVVCVWEREASFFFTRDMAGQMPRWVNYWVTAHSGWTTIQHTHLEWCCVCIPVTDLCTGYAQSSGCRFLLHFNLIALIHLWPAVFFPIFHSVKLQRDVFIYFIPFSFHKATGAGLPSAVRALPEFWKSPATLHPAVPSWAGVGIPAHHGQQRSSEQWVHRGPSLGHL